MNTGSILTHNLHGKWDLYYHLPHDKNWDLESYKLIISEISTMEVVVSINQFISEPIVKYTMLFIMRTGITPLWEDPKNRTGGAFSYKVANKLIFDVWKKLFCAICGESLFIQKEHNKFVNGITVSPKKNFCIVKIWLENCLIQDPDTIIDIPNLQKQGCLFKKHEPEF
jgi:hypothetical protein